MSTSRKTLDQADVTAADLDRLRNMKDNLIDDSDIPFTSKSFWKDATIRLPSGPKEQVTIRVDREIVDWFRSLGAGHTTRMSAVLRYYYEAHRTEK